MIVMLVAIFTVPHIPTPPFAGFFYAFQFYSKQVVSC